MKMIRLISAILLALPLIVFGSNYFFDFFSLPQEDTSAGATLLEMMRAGGLMNPIAFSHVVIGILLLMPKNRTFGGLLQLPLSIGIVSFHATMQPEGLAVALVMLLLNIAVIWDPKRISVLLS